MKKLSFVLAVALLFLFVSCGIEMEYYSNTSVPTFTCVTGITGSKKSGELDIYTYSCDETKKESTAKKYMNYLKNKCDFVVVSNEDEYDFVTLAKDGWGVIIDTTSDGAINIMPYKRAN